jgi:hypothetical protein
LGKLPDLSELLRHDAVKLSDRPFIADIQRGVYRRKLIGYDFGYDFGDRLREEPYRRDAIATGIAQETMKGVLLPPLSVWPFVRSAVNV